MAKASGLSTSSVQRIWRVFGLQPHRRETFKLSTDPDFVAKVHDVVGLYVARPERPVVLRVDEKSQIRALDRSQLMLPMRPDQPARRSYDYKRHGVVSLFAALDIATGRADIMSFLDTTPIRRPSAGPNPPPTSSPRSSGSSLETWPSVSQRTYGPGH
jgi:hypothetical protein